MECLSAGLGVDRWLSLWRVHTNEWNRNRSACLLSREIIQHCALVSIHKGHTVQRCNLMLYWAGASARTKVVMAAIKCSLRQWQHVNQLSAQCIYFPLIIHFHRTDMINCAAVPLCGTGGCLLNIVGVYASISLRAVVPLSPLLLHFPPLPRVSAKSTLFVFTAPLISSCFVPPDIAWCAEGMQLPEEFPHLPPFPNFTLSNWPRVP